MMSLLLTLSPLLGGLLTLFFRPRTGAGLSTALTWMGFLLFVSLSFFYAPLSAEWMITGLILFISSVVQHFSIRYLDGDRHYRRFFFLIGLLTSTMLLALAADHFFVFAFLWWCCNALLALLMTHNLRWEAARQSGWQAVSTLSFGSLLFLCASLLFWVDSGTVSISELTTRAPSDSIAMTLGLILLILAAMVQSGLWPFQSWLLSSLNSPTPVSSFMHAGLVNGGGLLLIRFAPLLLARSEMLMFLLLTGSLSIILGTAMKLVQPSIKRMLACSTMGQMGFMFMQCGLGLFPAALVHLLWHGLFKATLFMRSGSAAQSPPAKGPFCEWAFALSFATGSIGAIAFAWTHGHSLSLKDTSAILILFAWMGASQGCYALLKGAVNAATVALGALFSLGMGLLYGISVLSIQRALPQALEAPIPLEAVHLGLILLFFSLSVVFSLWIGKKVVFERLYVFLLNLSQPKHSTITMRGS